MSGFYFYSRSGTEEEYGTREQLLTEISDLEKEGSVSTKKETTVTIPKANLDIREAALSSLKDLKTRKVIT